MRSRIGIASARFARLAMTESVIIPRHALLRDALILDGGGEHHAVGELLDHGALDLLPGRLARRDVEAALAGERVAAGGCMLTTSAEPGEPIGPTPRITRTVRSSMPSEGSSMRW